MISLLLSKNYNMLPINQLLKAFSLKLMALSVLLFFTVSIQANNSYQLQESYNDTTTKRGHKARKAERKKEKAEGIKMLKENHARFLIKYDLIFANLKTRVTVNGPKGILNLSLSLEDNLGLPSRSSFSSLAFVYRMTKRSGLYFNYYGINRSEDLVTQDDLYFLGDTIPAGSGINTYFNTQIVSVGYMLSALINPDAYLGFYANLYVISLKTGFSSKSGNKGENLILTMPLPNFGFVGSFRLTKHMMFYGSMGVFSLNTENYGGLISNFNISIGYIPVRWLSVNLSYTEFNIRVYNNLGKEIDAVVEYNFRGPAIGLAFKF